MRRRAGEVHPGWVAKVSRMGALVQNLSSNKDALVETLASAVRELQTKKKRLMLLDECSMLFLYQALKANDHRMLGIYTGLDSLLQKCTQQGGGQVVDAKTRMIRIYDCRHWGYGIKGKASYTFEEVEEIPRTLFPVFGAVQPEVWYGHAWADALSGFWQHWGVVCTNPQDFEWPTDRNSVKSLSDLKKEFAQVLENVDTASTELAAAGKPPKFTAMGLLLGNGFTATVFARVLGAAIQAYERCQSVAHPSGQPPAANPVAHPLGPHIRSIKGVPTHAPTFA